MTELSLENVENILPFGETTIISYTRFFSKAPLINIAIASSITAYARLIMSKFKNNPKYTLIQGK